MTDSEPAASQRRRRRRPAGASNAPPPDSTPSARGRKGAEGTGRPPTGPNTAENGGLPERSWRDLAGNSPSQVGTGGATRTRDVCRPTDEDLAAAERDVVLVRRQWQPPEGGGPGRGRG